MTDDEVMTLIEDCEARESHLSEWEAGFIDSLRSQVEAGRTLTDKQAHKLSDVWERVTAHPAVR